MVKGKKGVARERPLSLFTLLARPERNPNHSLSHPDELSFRDPLSWLERELEERQ
jgi:hypothetical protein